MSDQKQSTVWQRLRGWFESRRRRLPRTPEEEAELQRADDKWRELEAEAYKERPGQVRF